VDFGARKRDKVLAYKLNAVFYDSQKSQAASQSRSDAKLVQLDAEIVIVILNKQSLPRNILALLKDNG
jgi:hypothetical protein